MTNTLLSTKGEKPKSYQLFLAIIYFLSFLLLATYCLNTSINFRDFILYDTQGNTLLEDIKMPLNIQSPPNKKEYILKGNISLQKFCPTTFRIIPDDKLKQIEINQRSVDLSNIEPSSLQNYTKGFIIDLRDYLNKEDNEIIFHFEDYGGRMGIDILAVETSAAGIVETSLWIVLGSIIAIFLLKKINFSLPDILLLMLGFALQIYYLMHTGYNQRAHDALEHLEYVEYFVNHWRLPPVSFALNGAYFHPPLYYLIASWVWRVFSWLSRGSLNTVYFSLQWFSAVCTFGYYIYGIKLIKLFFSNLEINRRNLSNDQSSFLNLWCLNSQTISAYFASALFIFWPSSILHSPRLGNDPMLYFLFITALYYWVKWYVNPSVNLFVTSMIITSFAVLTKLNAIILLVVASGLITVLVYKKGIVLFTSTLNSTSIVKVVFGFFISLFFVATALYPGIALRVTGERSHFYVDNIDNVSSNLRVPNRAANYLWFDLKTFINEPFTSPWDDSKGRLYFLNYLAKTGLFGEWTFSNAVSINSATIVSFAFVIMSILGIIGMLNLKIQDIPLLLPFLLCFTLLIAAVAYMRITFPVNIDFRYILPSICLYSIFYHYSIDIFQHNSWHRTVGIAYLFELIFILSSIVFILSIL